MQFCVTKSPTFDVLSLITGQLACNNIEVVNPLHPEFIGRLRINRFLLVTRSEYHAKYIHPLFNNSIHIAHLAQLNSSQSFSNIPTLFKQFHSSHFLPISRHYSVTLCTDIRSCRRGFTMTQFCFFYHQIVLSVLIKIQY